MSAPTTIDDGLMWLLFIVSQMLLALAFLWTLNESMKPVPGAADEPLTDAQYSALLGLALMPEEEIHALAAG